MNEPAHADLTFREVQSFRQSRLFVPVVLFALSGGVFFCYGMYQQYVIGIPFGSNPLSDTWLAVAGTAITGLLVGIVGLAATVKLVTEVRADGLHIRFRGLWVNRTIGYNEITLCEARTYRPIMEYGGWGVRWTFHKGKAYNVRGNRGVQLVLANGKFLLIGSQQADELAAAINARRETY
jgi:Family of unknown function (DUF6141)